MKGEKEGEQMVLRASKEKRKELQWGGGGGQGRHIVKGTAISVKLEENHSLGGLVFSGVTVGVGTGHQ